MHADAVSCFRLGPRALGDDLVLQARGRGDDARLLAVFSQEGGLGVQVLLALRRHFFLLLGLHPFREGLHDQHALLLGQQGLLAVQHVVNRTLDGGGINFAFHRFKRFTDIHANHVAHLLFLGGQSGDLRGGIRLGGGIGGGSLVRGILVGRAARGKRQGA